MEQGTTEWLEYRRNKIGASDAPVIMEVSPWKTPYQLWLEKCGAIEPHVNKSMKRGSVMEQEARNQFSNYIGVEVFPSVETHEHHDWMIASLDGRDIDKKIIVEIKCPGKEDHNLALDGKIPEKYYPQLQHQMSVCDVNKMFYYSYDGHKGVCVEVERNDYYIMQMIVAEMKFYDCMVSFYPPALSDGDFVEREDEDWENIALQWREVNQSLKDLKIREDDLRRKLIWLAGERDTKGAGIKLNKVVRRGQVDYKKIEQLQHLDLEPFRKPSTIFWTITPEDYK